MRAMRLTVQLTRWYPFDYSEARSHDHELELYLLFEGRQAYSLLDYGPSDLVPTFGTFGAQHQPIIFVDVLETTFPVKLVAIERDWPDRDDYASGEIIVQLGIEPPIRDCTIVAHGPRKKDHLKIEIDFRISFLSYVSSSSIGHEDDKTIQPENYPYPISWANDITVFQFWCGLGLNAKLHLDEAHQFSQRIFFMAPLNGAGRKGKQIITTYRFSEGQYFVGRNKKISSIYLPQGASATLHEFDFSNPNFASGRSLKLSNHGVTNLVDFGLDNQISAIEVVKVQFIPDEVRSPG